jgi:hypothetical protein
MPLDPRVLQQYAAAAACTVHPLQVENYQRSCVELFNCVNPLLYVQLTHTTPHDMALKSKSLHAAAFAHTQSLGQGPGFLLLAASAARALAALVSQVAGLLQALQYPDASSLLPALTYVVHSLKVGKPALGDQSAAAAAATVAQQCL